MKRLFVLLATTMLIAFAPGTSLADDNEKLEAKPFTFVGTAADCAPSPAGSRIVTAAWLGGMGLPDNGGTNATPATANDRHSGLLLSKNGPTPDCSSAGARILGVKGITTTATTALGFDYRNGGHCGAGAPRFNVVSRLAGVESFHFVGGCSNDSTPTPAPQDPAQWTRVRFEVASATESFPPILPGSTIVSISVLFDEGTDSVLVQDANGVGLAVIDNIFIDGRVITRGDKGKNPDKGDGGKDDDD